jgi:hypothetical protein
MSVVLGPPPNPGGLLSMLSLRRMPDFKPKYFLLTKSVGMARWNLRR